MAEDAKSKSGPSELGQFTLPGSWHELFHASFAVNCFDHRIWPEDHAQSDQGIAQGRGRIGIVIATGHVHDVSFGVEHGRSRTPTPEGPQPAAPRSGFDRALATVPIM